MEITFSEEEYTQFKYDSRRSNKILRFWCDEVFKKMPKMLQSEARSKPMYLLKKENSQSENEYIFTIRESSVELKKYLEQFKIFILTKNNFT